MNCAICFEKINNKLICRNCLKSYCKKCFIKTISKYPSALTLINDVVHIQCPSCSVDFNETDIIKTFDADIVEIIVKHVADFRTTYLKQKWSSKTLDMLGSTEDGIVQVKRIKKLRKIIDLFKEEGLDIQNLGEEYNKTASDKIIKAFKNYIDFWFEYEFLRNCSGEESIIDEILTEDYDFELLDQYKSYGNIAHEILHEVCCELLFSLQEEFEHIESDLTDLNGIDSFICPKCNIKILTSNFKCENCDIDICKECYCVITDNHKCNKDDVESFKLIKDSTKSCPKCSARIYKITGCSQMFCTECHTGFDWNTGKIITQNFHNPHRTEWLDKLEKQNIITNEETMICDYRIQKLSNGPKIYKSLIEYRNHCQDYLNELTESLKRNQPSEHELSGLTLENVFNGFDHYSGYGTSFKEVIEEQTETDLKIIAEYKIYETVLNIINPALITCDQMLVNMKSFDDCKKIYNNTMEIYTQYIDSEVLPILKTYKISFDFIKPKYIYQTYEVMDDYFHAYEYNINNKPQMYFTSYSLYKEMFNYLNNNKDKIPVKSFLDDENFGNINKKIPHEFYYVLHEYFSSDNLMIHEIANKNINNLLILLEKYHTLLTKKELIGLLVNVDPNFEHGFTREETWAWLETWMDEGLRGEIYEKTLELFLPYDKNGNAKKYISITVENNNKEVCSFIRDYRNKHGTTISSEVHLNHIVSINNYKYYWNGYGTRKYYDLINAAINII